MSASLWEQIAEKLNEHAYMDGIDRTTDRVRATAEVFTPTILVLEILRYVDLDLFSPGKTVLDPACGDGQFLVAAKWLKILHFGMNEEEALNDLYGIDIMRDNVDLCKRRLGGGTIVMGNALRPEQRLPHQTDKEYELMTTLFADAGLDLAPRRRRKASIQEADDGNLAEQLSLFT